MPLSLLATGMFVVEAFDLSMMAVRKLSFDYERARIRLVRS